ncbi:MAG: O-methyltransferase [Myxococcales bacterium]|nr:O-methyltransferase [Myxococcales bacterium]
MGEPWSAIDALFERHLLPNDPVLEAALADSVAAGLPPHAVSPTQGKLLHLLARMCGARRILEIGTLGGYSTIWLARALPEGGELLSLEISEDHAAVAHQNLARAGLPNAEVRVGDAHESLRALVAEGVAPFDLIFVDADKKSGPAYLDHALALSRRGTVIVVDNVVRGGAVLDEESADANVRGVRALLARMGNEPRLSATAIQTVGSKGYDGFTLAVVE